MSAPDPLRKDVKVAIFSAFEELRREGKERLYDAELADNYGMETPLTEELKELTYERWTEIPGDVIAKCPSALSYFEPKAFRFHVPAYMIWTLDNFRTSNSLSADMTIYSLLLSRGDEQLRSYELRRLKIFDDAQREAIIAFLRFAECNDDILDGHAARRALHNYWEPNG